MATAMPAAKALLTAEQYALRPDLGHPEELVDGRIVPMTVPNLRHGQICSQVVYLLRRFLEDHDLGHVLSNDPGVITRRDPDTVRGPDIAFYSYDRLPRGPLPSSYGRVLPELVVEVRSPSDRWPEVVAKAAEYLRAGVVVVVVLDEQRRSAHVFGAEGAMQILGSEDELSLPEVLGELRVRVGRFFE